MATKPSGPSGMKSSKARTLIILGGVIVIAIGLGIYFITKKSTVLQNEESKTSKLPQISSVPGGVTSERYQQLQEEENKRRAEAAKKTGTSSVATIIGSRGKDSLTGKETFGIEGQLLKNVGTCACPPGEAPTLDPALANQLIAEIEKDPSKAAILLKQHPGLGRALCQKNPELALKVAENDKESAKILLNECPEMAKLLAEKNPALFKQLMLENPALAKKLAEQNPELFKKLMLADPEFAKKLAQSNPDLVKNLMKNDPDFADKLGRANPELVKELMKNDPAFAALMAKNNPALVKKLMLDDPEFARTLARNNPDAVKALMLGDPEFAKKLAQANPTLVKELMKNDPNFAKQLAKQNPDLVKKLMLDDPEFAKAMARDNPDLVKELMKDPEFAKALREKNPGIDAVLGTEPTVEAKKGPAGTDQDRIRAYEEARRKQLLAQQAAQRQVQLSELQQKQLQALVQAMDAQSKAALQAWNEIPTQTFTQGEWARKQEEEERKKAKEKQPSAKEAAQAAEAQATRNALGGGIIKAGTILFAVLDTSVNSDEPGPVLATVVGGKYKGAKLLGNMKTQTIPGLDSPEKVSMEFNTMNVPSAPSSIPIKAVAIDPDTARTGLATSVDRHYLLRYGAMFASAFMTGYSKVITSQGTVQDTATNGQSVRTQSPELSGRKQIYAALGDVGKKWGEAVAPLANRPYTVTVKAGTSIGLLFTADVGGS